ncbi:alpha/beta hydrolase family esterase [Yoonia sp. 208BN28-4]|uniref:alpha/beta hydrolase family esterase n=1 Tax=Yoonia sp. 208BN28-4 TaxID=3126505 RepID=UPI00309C00FC
MKRLLCLLALIASPAFAQTNPNSVLPDAPCHGRDDPCQLDGREYHVKEPDGWDGVSPLPVLLHFHGWARTGAVPVYHGRISGATRRRGVLLVAPTGLNKTWNFRQNGSYDVEFANAVMADLADRYPIDEIRIYISGYSYGALMAWRYACDSGDSVAAMLSISAAYNSLSCDQAPTQVRSVYGLRDNVLDFPMGPDGDVTEPVRLWREMFDCAEPDPLTEWQATDVRVFTRYHWDCGARGVTLDLHPGGHLIPRGWIARQLDELLGLPNSYP